MSSLSDAIAVSSPRIFWGRDGSSHGEQVVFIHALGCNLRDQGLNVLAESILMCWLAPEFAEREPGVLRQARAWLVNAPANGYVASCASLRDTDLRPLPSGIRCPALVLCGEDDVATPRQLGYFCRLRPDMRSSCYVGSDTSRAGVNASAT